MSIFETLNRLPNERRTEMNAYSTIRNTGLATIAVAVLAGFITSGLAADQRIVYERDVPEAAAVAVLPEIVVSASRLPT
jgi:hypothetical protein